MGLKQAVDTLYLYDPQFEPAARAAIADIGGSSAMHPISNVDDVMKAVDSYSLVKFLIFDTHGSPGYVYLPDNNSLGASMLYILLDNRQFLSKNVRILFLGCNIGKGNDGDKFLDEVGRKLLKGRGGILGATTTINKVLQLGGLASQTYMDYWELFSGRLKVRRYDINGEKTGSIDARQSYSVF